MQRRSLFVSALVLLVLGVLWLSLRDRAPERTGGTAAEASPERVDEIARSAESPRSAISADVANADVRTEVIGTDVPPPDAVETWSAGRTLLVITIVEQGSRAPLQGIRVSARATQAIIETERHEIGGARAGLDEIPITGIDGRVWLEVPPLSEIELPYWSEGVSVQSGASHEPAFRAGERRSTVWTLTTQPDRVIVVRALDHERRTPIAGALVVARLERDALALRSDDGSSLAIDRQLANATTGGDGVARLGLHAADAAYLELSAPGYGRVLAAESAADTWPKPRASSTAPLDVPMQRSASLRGTLAGAHGGEIVLRADAWSLLPPELHTFWIPASPALFSASLDVTGAFVFEDLPPLCKLDALFVAADRKAQRVGESLQLAPGESSVVAWQLGGSCTLRGRVLDQDSRPVTDGEVWLVRPFFDVRGIARRLAAGVDGSSVFARASLTADGTFEFRGVPSGSFGLGLPARESDGEPPIHGVAGLAVQVEIAPGETSKETDLRVDRDLFLSGRVLDPQGRRVSDGSVTVRRIGLWELEGQSFEEGQFRIGPLVRGRYRIEAESFEHAASTAIEVDAGADDLVLQLNSGGSILGRVSLPGAPFEGCELYLIPGSDTGIKYLSQLGQTSADGAFRFDALTPGTYHLFAAARGGRVAILHGVTVRGGQATRDVELRLAPGARLNVRCGAEAKFLVARHEDVDIVHQEIVPNATNELWVPAGSIRLELANVRQQGSELVRDVVATLAFDVISGELREIELH